MKIVVMGPTAAGKTSVSKVIAAHFGLKYVSGSQLLLSKLAYDADSREHFWLSATGKELDKQRRDQSLDRAVDETLLSIALTQDDVVFDARTIAWLYPESDLIKVYLRPNLEYRAIWAYGSKGVKEFTHRDLKRYITHKDTVDRKRFLDMYRCDIQELDRFHIVLDNSAMGTPEAAANAIERISKLGGLC